jgi:hypothetical protein
MNSSLRNHGQNARISTLFLVLAAIGPAAVAQEINYSQDSQAEKRMTLLLKDRNPKAMVHLAQREVPRAKFYVIDVHNHVNDVGGIHGDEAPPADVVNAMDAANARRIVILTGMWGEAFTKRVGQDSEAVPRPLHGVRTDGLEQDRRSKFQPGNDDATG